ncbi:MAG TPA: hypothetical protein VHB25_01410 [Gemmatimonadaceae bacterium]|nr:hypothetical protein [Gemmatimonadaceae bacterium]
MSEWSYIIAAYGVTWIVLLGTALYLATRDGAARRAFRAHSAEG